MKIQAKHLDGEALNWVVAKILEPDDGRLTVIRNHRIRGLMVEREVEHGSAPDFEWFCPIRIVKQARRIIDREKISTVMRSDGCWSARTHENAVGNAEDATGPTPQIAALRCYVASRLGPEVEVPVELLPALVRQDAPGLHSLSFQEISSRSGLPTNRPRG